MTDHDRDYWRKLKEEEEGGPKLTGLAALHAAAAERDRIRREGEKRAKQHEQQRQNNPSESERSERLEQRLGDFRSKIANAMAENVLELHERIDALEEEIKELRRQHAAESGDAGVADFRGRRRA